jgi:opacity protein-like surface antigen
MIGVSAWADYNVFHGLGIEAKGTSIFADKPEVLTRMKQDSLMGGLIYKYHAVFRVRPLVSAAGGVGSIDFPDRNPLYTHDTFSTYALSGGGEFRTWNTLTIRASYDYQFWLNYHGKHTLNPNGVTIGATYYLRGIHHHY